MQIKKIASRACLLAALGLATQFAGCGGGGGDTAPQGTLHVALTNTGSSACGYDAVNVSIDAVKANQSASAGPGDDEWQPKEVTLVQSKKVDLLSLVNSPPQELTSLQLPAGHYAQIRLWLEGPSVLIAMPNSVVRAGTKFALDTSGVPSIGIPHAIDIPANGQVNLILNFDACGSVVETGSGTFQLVPAITATSTAGA